MSPDLAARIAALGRVIDPPATAALYAPLHDREPYAGITVTRNVAYGPLERQRLDVFQAEDTPGARPVLIFIHGGGFTGGNKSMPGSPFYDNVSLWAARHGLVGVNMTYPLAPEAVWPSASENIARVVQWVQKHITAHRGDPARIFLFGHSAGATHAATYAAFPQIHGNETGLAGLILMSGIYDFTTFPPAPNYQAYIGADTSLYGPRSPLPGLQTSALPKLVVAAELDPPPFIAQFESLTAALAGAKVHTKVHTLLLPQHSHLSAGYAIGTDDTRLTGPILDFIGAQR